VSSLESWFASRVSHILTISHQQDQAEVICDSCGLLTTTDAQTAGAAVAEHRLNFVELIGQST